MSCPSPAGVGTNFSVVLSVGGVGSLPFWPAAALSYGIPTVSALSVQPSPQDPSRGVGMTRGGSLVVISGGNFGSVALNAVTGVTYT